MALEGAGRIDEVLNISLQNIHFKQKVATAKTNSKCVAKITIKNPNVVKKLKVGKKVTYQATYLRYC